MENLSSNIICKICGKNCKSIRSLSGHIDKLHGLKLLDYFIKYESLKIPKCKYCNNGAKRFHSGIRFRTTCGSKECVRKVNTVSHSEETKEKIRRKRFEYLKKQNGKTAWERRNKNQMSYLEKWFLENIIEKYNLTEKYDISNEYPFYPYFIDFAFLNIKLAVELDGGTHFNKDGTYIERDIKKNNHLISNGWNVYRINYQEINDDKILEFIDFLETINIDNIKLLSNKLYKGSLKETKYNRSRKNKYGNSKQYKQKKREEYLKSQKEKIEILQESNIDFSKFGWGAKVSKLIIINPHRIAVWMRKCCPEIWENAYKTKRSNELK